MKIGEDHRRAVQMLILDRWSKELSSARIAETLGTTERTIQRWRNDADFQAEYDRQLAIFQGNFADIQLADRKERVRVLNDLFFLLGDSQRDTRLKLEILGQIKAEMGVGTESSKVQVQVGINLPPRADSYDEWVQQNKEMERKRVVEADYEVEE